MLLYKEQSCQKFPGRIWQKQPTTWPGNVSAAQLTHAPGTGDQWPSDTNTKCRGAWPALHLLLPQY